MDTSNFLKGVSLFSSLKDEGIQELLGHASLSTTQTYTEIDVKKLMDVYANAHPRCKTAI